MRKNAGKELSKMMNTNISNTLGFHGMSCILFSE